MISLSRLKLDSNELIPYLKCSCCALDPNYRFKTCDSGETIGQFVGGLW